MLKVTTSEKVQMAPPDQGWSLIPGANHFEGEFPEAVAKRLAELQSKGVVKVESLGIDGKATAFDFAAPAESSKFKG